MRETSRLITSTPDIRLLLELLYEEIRKLFPADTYFVILYDSATDEASFEILIDEGEYFPPVRRKLKSGLARWVIRNRQPLLVRDMDKDAPVRPIRLGQTKMSRSWLGVPMLLSDRVIGVLVAASYQPDVYDEEDLDVLQHVANQAAVAIENARLGQEAERRLRELGALQKVSLELVSSLDLSAVLELVTRTALELTRASDAHIFLYNQASGQLSFGAALWSTGESGLRAETTPRPGGITMTAIRTGEPVVISDCESHPLYAEPERRKWGLKSIISLPLKRVNTVLGALNVAYLEPHPFGEAELHLLSVLADQAAIAIDNARLYQQARDRAERLAVVEQIAKTITSTFDLREIMSAISEALASLVPHQHMNLCLWGEKSGTLKIVGAVGLEVPSLGEGMMIPLEETSLVRVVRERVPDVIRTPENTACRLAQAFAEAGLQSLAAAPVVVGDTCTGVWVLGCTEPDAFGPSQVQLLGQVSGHLAIAVKNARLYAELEQAFDRLKESQSQLVRSERMRALAELSAGVAHDFNNVLTSILGRVQLLLLQARDPALRESLQVIEQAARNGAQTVRRIMGFARHREGEAFSPLDVNRLVEDAILLTEPRWSASVSDGPMIDLKFRRSRTGPIMGSAAELSEVLTNLVFNAVDAMPRGGKIQLETRQEDEEVVVRVQDTGAGMGSEVMDRLFTPFFTTKGGMSAGMGLSVAREIVARHGGRIEVESQLGKGSTFSVRLPVARDAQVPGAEEGLRMKEPLRKKRNVSILVVEDEESIRRLLSSILGMEGHEVRTTGNALDGIAYFKERPADLVITDLGLPDQSGWEVARQVKSLSPKVPVILITGWGVSAEVTEARQRGVDYILPKPFEFEELSELIGRALDEMEKKE
jgi:signal transduction histidine kinase/ActR/RegA family two-component response regulator/putative methionine-R-sulfoxide reductase with GAF domain